jgi:hypothetical protein
VVAVLGLILAAAAILLFQFNLRRAGESAGRAAERLDARERNDAIRRQMLDAAARSPHDRGALADPAARRAILRPFRRARRCLSTALTIRRADAEVEALTEGAVIVRMLGDYAVPRDQARPCQRCRYPKR